MRTLLTAAKLNALETVSKLPIAVMRLIASAAAEHVYNMIAG